MTSAASSKTCTILLIEDEEVMRDTVRDALVLDGHRCVTADSMDDAMKRLEADRPAVVLLDLRVADASTEPWIGEIRASGAGVVLFSASPRCEAIASRHGIDALPKPFELDQLSALIAKLCARAHATVAIGA
jgi:two-component system KDP operon response regulator KdpE